MDAIKLLAKIFLLGAILNVVPCCITTMDSRVSMNAAPEKDNAYYPLLLKNTQNLEVYHQFETKFMVNATFLVTDFKKAFANRLRNLYEKDSAYFSEVKANAAFFISLFSPDEAALHLEDQELWSVFLLYQGKTHAPLIIQKLPDKNRWIPFFPYISKWSKEFLVIFDIPLFTSSEIQLVEIEKLELHLAHAEARISLTY